MIELEMQIALLLYLALLLTFFFGMWLCSHLKRKKRRDAPPLFDLTTCEYCHFPYLANTTKKVSKCPQCSSLNAIYR